MAIFIDNNTKILVQGINGKTGSFHTQQMLTYGNVVAGVSYTESIDFLYDIPVFDNVKTAVEKTAANASIIFVPARFAKAAILEAEQAGIKLIVCITEGIPVADMVEIKHKLKSSKSRLIGPNCPGIISPELSKMGIMPSDIFLKGDVGIISRSGTLTYEAVAQTTKNGLGQSTCVGIGGDQIIGTNFIQTLAEFEKDQQTKAIILIGEIGGQAEEEAAEFIKNNISKPVVAFIAGASAPKGKTMGHAGAVVDLGIGTAESKYLALAKAGVKICRNPAKLGETVKEIIYKNSKKC